MSYNKYKTKNDETWEKIFHEFDILKNITKYGYYTITSKEINKYRESRLMTKFDHINNLPEIFKQNNLSILPITRGSYIISNYKAYEKLSYQPKKPIEIPKRTDLETLEYDNIYSESMAINIAFASGIISDVIGQESEFTVNGRMSSSKFYFDIDSIDSQEKKNIQIENTQCEIDAGFESESHFAIIEAKNTICNDFLIRQLYFPYRLWQNKISKKILPIFMTFSNDRFSFFIYQFDNIHDYNSLRLVEQKDYVLSSEPITLEDIKNLLRTTPTLKKEPSIPFPQADKFDRVIDLLGLLTINNLSIEEITRNYDFDIRQTDYYFNSARYLGLVERFKDIDGIRRHQLTKEGKKIMTLNHKEKNLQIIGKILQHKTFRDTLKYYLDYHKKPQKKTVINLMKKNNLYKINKESTFERRSQTVVKWADWILEQIEQ